MTSACDGVLSVGGSTHSAPYLPFAARRRYGSAREGFKSGLFVFAQVTLGEQNHLRNHTGMYAQLLGKPPLCGNSISATVSAVPWKHSLLGFPSAARILRVSFLALLTSCVLDVDHSSNSYRCVEEEVCPPGYECAEGVCVADNAQRLDAAVVDAGVFDARMMVDGASVLVDAKVVPDAKPAPPDADLGIVIVQVNASSDDAEENMQEASMDFGTIDLTSSDLELGVNADIAQGVGMRFANVQIPQGTNITKAYIQFTADEVDTEYASLRIYGEATAYPLTFESNYQNISTRSLFSAYTSWEPQPWPTVDASGLDQRTPDLITIIQGLVNDPEWSSGNSIVLLIGGSGRRTAKSFDQSPADAPRLVIHL